MTSSGSAAQELTKSERYVAFLLAELPKLKTVSLQAGSFTPARAKKRDVLVTTLKLLPEEGEGVCLEFGVYQGDSLRMAGKMLPRRRFFGFDSFEGFPSDGRPDWSEDFTVDGLPRVPENCELVKGWFNETLLAFLEKHEGLKADFVNIDCDIYSSTREVLHLLGRSGAIGPGTLIYMDEALNYKTWLWNEMLALFEFLEETGFGIEWLAMCQNVFLVDDALTMLRDGKYPSWPRHRKLGYRLSASCRLTDKGPDYGPLHLPHYREKVREMANLFDKLTKEFEAGRIVAKQEPNVWYKLRKGMKRLLKGQGKS